MTEIVTITPSPAVDLSTAVDRILPVAKLRGQSQRRDPGGGGINVARVIRRLGGDARAIYPVGGAIGRLLRQLLDQEGVASHTWTIAGETRENSSSTRSARASSTASFFPVRGFKSSSGRSA